MSLRVRASARGTGGNNKMDPLIFWPGDLPSVYSAASKFGFWVLRPLVTCEGRALLEGDNKKRCGET